eukprot:6197983-Pleurochrysis_carterae.AAC.1
MSSQVHISSMWEALLHDLAEGEELIEGQQHVQQALAHPATPCTYDTQAVWIGAALGLCALCLLALRERLVPKEVALCRLGRRISLLVARADEGDDTCECQLGEE